MRSKLLKKRYFENVEITREYLEPSELFVINYLNSFDRKVARKWTEMDLWP